jgi:tetratricopeptide (TPR) repeat protein
MNPPDLQQIRAAVAQNPRNAELRYLLGAELAQQKKYEAAVVEMSNALALDPNLHFARFQLGLLYLTMAQPANSLATWAPLEALDETAALKFFKRGLEALIRDEFDTCVGLLRQGIRLNKQNATLNHDMTLVIDRVDEAYVSTCTVEELDAVHAGISMYGESRGLKH